MKKNEFVKVIAEKLSVSQKRAREVADVFGETIVECMQDEDGVTPFCGMKFSTEYREAHTGRNPLTGETIHVEGKYRPKVKFGNTVKDAINK